jgi:magnesium-transporting ATPase (P-type)
MAEHGLCLSAEHEHQVAALEHTGHTVILVAYDPVVLVAVPAEGGAECKAEGGAECKAEGGAECKAEGGATAEEAHEACETRRRALPLAGAIAMADALKPEAPSVIKQLKAMGIACWMVSGDNERTAAHIAAAAGLHPAHVVSGVKVRRRANTNVVHACSKQSMLYRSSRRCGWTGAAA